MIIIYWLICLTIGIGAFYWVWQRDKRSTHTYKWIPSVLRGLVFFIVSALLLAPAFKFKFNKIQKPIIVWLQDNSTSIKDYLQGDTSTFMKQINELQSSLEADYDVVTLPFGDGLETEHNVNFSAPITDIEQALLQVNQRYKGSNLGAIILNSDGIYNEGSDPNFIAQSFQVPIYSIAVGDSSQVRDISVLRVFANKVVMVGNSFEVAVDVRFSKLPNSTHAVLLMQQGTTIAQQSTQISGDDEVKSLSFEVQAKQPGYYHYTIYVPEAEGEKTLMNNTIDFYVQVVSNDVKVAIVNGGTHGDIGFIRKTLQAAVGYQVEILPPNTLPSNLSNYDIIIAHQPTLSPAQWTALQQAKMPIWHILGLQTTGTQGQFIENYVKLAGSRQGMMHQAVLQRRFGGFLLPVNASTVIPKLPPLESVVSSAQSKDATAVVLQSKDTKTDMWMLYTGTPTVAVTIGEGLWRWAIYEYKDQRNQLVAEELVRQTMRLLHVPKQDKPFQVFLNKRLHTDNENIAFTAELKNASGQLVNDAIAQLMIADSAGNQKTYEFEKFGNSYHILIPKLSAGIYSYKGVVSYQGNNHADEGTFAVENIPLELLNTQADFGVMYQLAQQSNGKFYTMEDMTEIVSDIQQNNQIKNVIITTDKQDPFINYKWLFFVILALLTIEWLWRKYNHQQ